MVVIIVYTLDEIKLAAYNRQLLPDLKPNESALWQGLAYCYDWFRTNPNNQTAECKQLAEEYVQIYWLKQQVRELS